MEWKWVDNKSRHIHQHKLLKKRHNPHQKEEVQILKMNKEVEVEPKHPQNKQFKLVLSRQIINSQLLKLNQNNHLTFGITFYH
jgi:hypothetical protein